MHSSEADRTEQKGGAWFTVVAGMAHPSGVEMAVMRSSNAAAWQLRGCVSEGNCKRGLRALKRVCQEAQGSIVGDVGVVADVRVMQRW